jgi:archaemetzincin
MKVTLKPIGLVDVRVLEHLRTNLAGFGTLVVADPAPLPVARYDTGRDQYRATDLFETCLPEPGDRVLGVTDADLYEGELESVFGYAQIGGRVAVISLARLQSRPRGDRAQPTILRRRAVVRRQRFLDRCVKEAVHELGHTLGLAHDTRDPECVMYYSERLADTDRKGPDFCPECARLIGLTLTRLGR